MAEAKADGDKKKTEGDDDEARLEFLLNYLTKSMRMKQEKWNKMIQIDENRVSTFFKPLVGRFLFSGSQGGSAKNTVVWQLLQPSTTRIELNEVILLSRSL